MRAEAESLLRDEDQPDAIHTCCVLGPVGKINLANGDPGTWPENTSGNNAVELAAVQNPVLPMVAGDCTGQGPDRQWQDCPLRRLKLLEKWGGDCFWKPMLSVGDDRPAVAGGERDGRLAGACKKIAEECAAPPWTTRPSC